MSTDEPTPPPLPDGEAGIDGDAEIDVDPALATGVDPDADPATAEALRQRALLHVTEQTRTYPCRACGGELEFHIGKQLLVCPHCGDEQDIIENTDASVDEQDYAAAIEALRSGVLERPGGGEAGEHEVVCQNCGGHTTFNGSLTATRCPWCATPIQRDDVHDAPSRLPVDGVLPFQVDDDTAKQKLKEWVRSRWFAPNDFKKYSKAGSFASVYAAYFTYDSDTSSRYTGQRGDNYTVTVGHGENRRTETRIRWRRVSGGVTNLFDDLAVLANEGLDRRYVQKLEPWPTRDARPFSAEYIAGHLCRTYDHDVEDCFTEAKQRMDEMIRDSIRRDIGGDHQRIHSVNTSHHSLLYKHLLLPIWLLTVLFQGQPFQVVMNGVTGEVHGERPWSWIKITLAAIAAAIVLGGAYWLYQQNG